MRRIWKIKGAFFAVSAVGAVIVLSCAVGGEGDSTFYWAAMGALVLLARAPHAYAIGRLYWNDDLATFRRFLSNQQGWEPYTSWTSNRLAANGFASGYVVQYCVSLAESGDPAFTRLTIHIPDVDEDVVPVDPEQLPDPSALAPEAADNPTLEPCPMGFQLRFDALLSTRREYRKLLDDTVALADELDLSHLEKPPPTEW